MEDFFQLHDIDKETMDLLNNCGLPVKYYSSDLSYGYMDRIERPYSVPPEITDIILDEDEEPIEIRFYWI
ncbi:MAG: hypothetical protein GXP63_02390 [DPANN group archaeon]|nr:hypothetical protein [DPANN group archaeon]